MELDFPSIAFREAVVNAFVHRDYLLHSDIKIELFDDRLEIVSPGVNCYTVSSKEKDDLESW